MHFNDFNQFKNEANLFGDGNVFYIIYMMDLWERCEEKGNKKVEKTAMNGWNALIFEWNLLRWHVSWLWWYVHSGFCWIYRWIERWNRTMVALDDRHPITSGQLHSKCCGSFDHHGDIWYLQFVHSMKRPFIYKHKMRINNEIQHTNVLYLRVTHFTSTYGSDSMHENISWKPSDCGWIW